MVVMRNPLEFKLLGGCCCGAAIRLLKNLTGIRGLWGVIGRRTCIGYPGIAEIV
jgi:hypothetical protein